MSDRSKRFWSWVHHWLGPSSTLLAAAIAGLYTYYAYKQSQSMTMQSDSMASQMGLMKDQLEMMASQDKTMREQLDLATSQTVIDRGKLVITNCTGPYLSADKKKILIPRLRVRSVKGAVDIFRIWGDVVSGINGKPATDLQHLGAYILPYNVTVTEKTSTIDLQKMKDWKGELDKADIQKKIKGLNSFLLELYYIGRIEYRDASGRTNYLPFCQTFFTDHDGGCEECKQ